MKTLGLLRHAKSDWDDMALRDYDRGLNDRGRRGAVVMGGHIRARLAQAFGRLIRSADDSGHFVVLSPAFPTRLLSAFPPGTPVRRLTLDEALQRVAAGVFSIGGESALPTREEERD